MSHHPHSVTPTQRSIGRIAMLVVVLALIGNVVAFAWLRPYGILRDLSPVAEARENIHAYFVDEVEDQQLIDAAIRGMVDSLGDHNTNYLSEEDLAEFTAHMSGQFSGIGAEVDIFEGRVRIVAPLDGSPAWNSGLMPGDIVLEIDGQDTTGLDINDAILLIKGEVGTEVRLRVRHRDGTIQDIAVTRAVIAVDTVRGFRRNPGDGYYYMIDPDQRIAYVRLTQFGDTSAADLTARLQSLKDEGMAALILDLRDNTGGLLDGAIAISDLFLNAGQTIVSTQGRSEGAMTTRATSQTMLPNLPVVVLMNEMSASASEIVAGALLDNDRALLVGTRSYGKGSVQQLLYLGDGSSAMKLTTAHWYLPSGRLIHRHEGAEQWGVDPSPGCVVPMDDEAVREMYLRRREAESDDTFDALAGQAITPQWVRENLLDDQLAAALDGAQSRLTTGAWPQVGITLEEAMTPLTDMQALQQMRIRLMEQLEQVDRQIQSLDAGVEEPAAEAEPSTQDTPEAVEQP